MFVLYNFKENNVFVFQEAVKVVFEKIAKIQKKAKNPYNESLGRVYSKHIYEGFLTATV